MFKSINKQEFQHSARSKMLLQVPKSLNSPI